MPSRIKWSGRSLALKLTLIMTTLVVVAVASITFLSIHREQQTFRVELQYQANLLLDTLEVVVRDPLYRLDVDFVTDLVIALGKDQDYLASSYVYDADGRLIADGFSKQPVYVTSIDPFGHRLVRSEATILEWRSDQLIAGRAVIVGRQCLGAISIGLSTTPLQIKIDRVRNRGLGVAITAGIVSTVLALVVSRSITNPLEELARAAQQIAKGNFDRRVHLRSQDELAIVADAFNDMAGRLQQTLTLLEQNNEDLEERVRQRTEQLSEALQDLQQTQAHLVQSEKMSSLGQLVAGVAHELNNPVSFISGNLEYADEYTQNLLRLLKLYEQHYPQPATEIKTEAEAIDLDFLKSDLPRLLKSMEIGSERIHDIVKSLRSFSRLDEAEFKRVNIHEGIDSTLMILRSRFMEPKRSNIEVVKNYGELPLVECYPGQLNQVFMNIIANAIDALEVAQNSPASIENVGMNAPPTIHISTEAVQENRIAIHIADNGAGMTESVRSKLFDPFFTTKPVGKGTGLGLSISYQIVTQKHHGKLFCQSALGQGTEFVIQIPIWQSDRTV